MMKVNIKLKSAKDAALFVTKCEEYKDYDIDYKHGRYILDALSLLGIISVGFEHVCEIVLHCEDEKICENFKNDISLWITDEHPDIVTNW